MTTVWSSEDIDALLEMVLAADSDVQYWRSLVAFGKIHGRDPKISTSEGDQLLRRRANRRTDYIKHSESSRTSRSGLPFTWAEHRILSWASKKENSESRVEVTNEYLAELLQRSRDEIVSEIDRLENTKFGVRGFDI